MKVPFYNIYTHPLSFLTATLIAFFVGIILVPGFFIWIGLRVLGKDVGILRTGFANFIAVVFASVITYLLIPTPLFILTPLLSFVSYFYALKSLLDVSFVEAFAATIIASIVILVIAFVMIAFFSLPLPLPHFHIHF